MATFAEIAADPFGEAMVPVLHVRLNDGFAGAPSTLVTVTDSQTILGITPIARRRERSFGTVQGQAWQIRLTNTGLALSDYALKGCWAALYGHFPGADVSQIFAQGQIKKVTVSVDNTVTLEVHDKVMDVLGVRLTRDINFQSTGWVSAVKNRAKASGSGSYSSGTALTLNTPTAADDETFIIEFTSGTGFKVILEDGDETQTGTTSTACNVTNVAGDTNIVTIPSAGWSGSFSTGDQFVFYTARARTAAELSPVNMVIHLIDDLAGLSSYDVVAGSYYSSARYATAEWSTRGTAAANREIGGEWAAGSRLSSMVQDALKVVHGSIYPTATGQIALWVLEPSTSVAVSLNGNPASGPVSILSGSYSDDLGDAITDVTLNYLALDGGDAVCTAVNEAPTPLEKTTATLDIRWRVDGIYAQDACDKYLNRFKDGIGEYVLRTTLIGALAEIGQGLSLAENELGFANAMTDATDIAVDMIANAATVKGHTDPVILEDYFILGTSLINGPEVLW